MSRRLQILGFAAIVLFLIAGFARLYSDRLSGGDLFPPYSTLRADPLGTRAYFEALSEMPGLTVRRWMRPFQKLDTSRPATIILPGMTREAWADFVRQESDALDVLVRGGSRIVVVFAPELTPQAATPPARKESPTEAARTKKREEEAAKQEAELPERLRRTDWVQLWSVAAKLRWMADRGQGAVRADGAGDRLPPTLPWKSEVYFDASFGSSNSVAASAALARVGWKTLYTRASFPVLIERRRGLGSIVLASDAYFLSNEALRDRRFPELLSWLVGSQASVVFCETHLGVKEDLGIAALARRYGLTGAAALALVLAALFIWRRTALFVPPLPESEETALAYSQTAGLEALLRRAVKPADLISCCIGEWKQAARSSDEARAHAALAALPPNASVPERYNAIVRALKRR